MKKIYLFCLLLIILLTMIPYSIFASEVENNMVYAAKDDQDRIFQLTQKESFDFYRHLEYYGLKIVKESITPVYFIDILEYAKTGTLTVRPMVAGKAESSDNTQKGNVYIAKVVTSENEYGGNLRFYIEDDTAYCLGFAPSAAEKSGYPSRYYEASCSYVDHASRIQGILNESKPISVYNVKYVSIDYVGDCFFVENNAKQAIIPVGYHNVEKADKIDVILNETELKEVADEQLNMYNSRKKEREDWEKEHPGEVCDLTGYESAAPIISRCSHVDNILNIFEYIENDLHIPIHNAMAETPNKPDAAQPRLALWCGIIAGTIAGIAAIAVPLVIRAKKRRRTNG